jgi:Fic family protein
MDDTRKYLTSHAWINFKLDLSNAPYDLWIMLGGAESKCRHLAGIPLHPEVQQRLHTFSLQRGVRATTAIEGNTLSEEEVRKIAEDRNTEFPRSKEYQRKEVENAFSAYNSVIAEISENGFCSVSYEQIKKDNMTFLNGLKLKEEVIPGEIRTHSVTVSRYLGAPAEDCDYLMRRLFEWLQEDWRFGPDHEVIEGILKAIMAHLYVAWIHPFGDGNGRCSRLLEFRLLMNARVPSTAAHLLTKHYNDTRTEYYDALTETSGPSEGNPVIFLLYALQGFVDALDNQIETILGEQLNVAWENYIHTSVFKGALSEPQARKRDLLLEISSFEIPVPIGELIKRLGLSLLKKYEKKTPRALHRDINALEQLGLIIRTNNGIIAAKDKMKAFLPVSRTSR